MILILMCRFNSLNLTTFMADLNQLSKLWSEDKPDSCPSIILNNGVNNFKN